MQEGQGAYRIGDRRVANAFSTLGRRIERQSIGEAQLVVDADDRRIVLTIRAGDLVGAPRLRMIADTTANAEIGDAVIRGIARQQDLAMARL